MTYNVSMGTLNPTIPYHTYTITSVRDVDHCMAYIYPVKVRIAQLPALVLTCHDLHRRPIA